MGCNQSTSAYDEHTDRNVRTSTNKRLVFGFRFGKGEPGSVEAKLLGGYESGFKRVYDDTGGGEVIAKADATKNDEQTAQPVRTLVCRAKISPLVFQSI